MNRKLRHDIDLVALRLKRMGLPYVAKQFKQHPLATGSSWKPLVEDQLFMGNIDRREMGRAMKILWDWTMAAKDQGHRLKPVRFSTAASRVAARHHKKYASKTDMDALSHAIDDLSDGLADIMDHHSLQWRDTPGLAKAQSDIMHALSAYQDELEKFYSQEKARLEAERLERERLERAHQEKERQKKERHDTFKKLERLADKVFKDWARERGDGLSWMFSHSPGRFPTAEAAVEEYMKGAAKLLGGMPGIGKSNPKDPRRGGYIRAFLNNGRMFDIKINADIPPVERDGGSMADLALSIEQKE